MMKDYYKMPDETKEVMVDGLLSYRDMGIWMRTVIFISADARAI